MMKKHVFTAVLVLCITFLGLVSSAYAQSGMWEPFGVQGQEVYSIAVDQTDNRVIYVGTASGIFKRNRNTGDWELKNAGLPGDYVYALALDPRNSQIVYAGTASNGVFKSTDGGESWTPQSAGLGSLQVLSLAVDVGNSAVVYAGTHGGTGVYVSDDGANSWRAPTFPPTNDIGYIVKSAGACNVYVGTFGGGVFNSTDCGLNWTYKGPETDNYICGLTFLPQDVTRQIIHVGDSGSGTPTPPAPAQQAKGAYITTDGGDNWAVDNAGLYQGYRQIADLTADWEGNVYAAITGSGVYKRDYELNSWADVSTGLGPKDRTLCLATGDVTPEAIYTPQAIYAGTRDGLWRYWAYRAATPTPSPSPTGPAPATPTPHINIVIDKQIQSGSDTATLPGDILGYTIKATNIGNTEGDVTIIDRLPAEVEVLTETIFPATAWNQVDNTLTWNATLAPGPSWIGLFNARVKPNFGDTLNSAHAFAPPASVLSGPLARVDAPKAQPKSIAPAGIGLAAPDFEVTKEAYPSPRTGIPYVFRQGDLVEYVIRIKNRDTMSDATGLVVSDTIPDNTDFVEGSLIVDMASSYVTGTPPLLIADADLPVGQSITLSFHVRITTPPPLLLAGTEIINHVAVSCAETTTPVRRSAVISITSAPFLIITEESSAEGPIYIDDVITYTITVTNVGGAPTNGASVNVNLGAADYVPNSTEVSANGIAGVFPVIANPIILNPGSVFFATFQVTVTGATGSYADDGMAITNTAWATCPQCSLPMSATVSDQLRIYKITKTSDGGGRAGEVYQDHLVTYTVNVRNTARSGSDSALLISDTLPANTAFVSDSIRVYGGAAGTLPTLATFAAVAPKAALSATYQALVAKPLTYGAVITNIAAVSSAGVPASNTALVTDVVRPAVRLTMTKFAAPSNVITPGLRITYTIFVSNTGDAAATGLVISDTVPENTEFVAGSLYVGSGVPNAAPPILAEGVIISADSFVSATYQVTVTSPLTNGIQITNVAAVISASGAVLLTDTVVVTVASAPLLTMTKFSEPADIVRPGDRVTYTVVVSNIGTTYAAGVSIRDLLPPHTNFVAGDAPPWLVQNITIPAGSRVTATYVVTISTPLTNGLNITNTATLTTADSVWLITDTHVLTVVAAARFTITKRAEPQSLVQPGDSITYTVIVTNYGDAHAAGLTISDTLPEHTTFVADSIQLYGAGTVGAAPPNLAQDVTVPAGTSVSVTYQVSVASPLANGVEIINTATVITVGGGAVGTATISHTVDSAPIIVVDKRADPLNVIQPDEVITYTIVVANEGNMDAVGLTLSDTLPEYTDFIAGSLQFYGAGTPGTALPILASDVTIPVASRVSATYQVTVQSPLADGTEIRNVAAVISGATVLTTDTVTHAVSASPLLTMAKSAAPSGTLHPGDRVTYTIVVANDGNMDAVGLSISDSVPAHTIFVAGSIRFYGTGTRRTVPPTLAQDVVVPAGAKVSATYQVLVRSPLDNGTEIVNTAAVISGSTTLLTATATNAISSAIALTMTKLTEPPGAVRPGAVLTYTVIITNAGDMNAVGLSISDTAPAHTVFVTNSLQFYGSGISGAAPPLLAEDVIISAGQRVSATYQVTVVTPLTAELEIINRAAVLSGGAVLATGTAANQIDAAPLFAVSKRASYSAPLKAGAVITYTIAVTNSGDANATGVVLSDTIPELTGFVNGSKTLSPTCASCLQTTPPILAQNIRIDAGRNILLTYQVRVASVVPTDTLIINRVSVTSSEVLTPVEADVADWAFANTPTPTSTPTRTPTPTPTATPTETPTPTTTPTFVPRAIVNCAEVHYINTAGTPVVRVDCTNRYVNPRLLYMPIMLKNYTPN